MRSYPASAFVLAAMLVAACASRPPSGNAVYSPDAPKPTRSTSDPRSGEATGALVGQLIDTAAGRGTVPGGVLEGRCVTRPESGTTLELPCANMTILLVDEKGAIAERTRVEGGAFRFSVAPGRKYRVRIESTKYDLRSPGGPFTAGDDVRLELVRRP